MMNPRFESPANIYIRWLLRFLMVAATGYILWRTRPIVVTVLISAVLAYALEPIVGWLCRWRIRFLHPKVQRLLATCIVFAGFIGSAVGLVFWLAAPFGHEFKRLGDYGALIKSAIDEFQQDVIRVYNNLPEIVKELLPQRDANEISKRIYALSGSALAGAKAWISHLWEVFVIPVFAFYFVLDSGPIKKYFVSFFPKRYRREVMSVLRDTSRVFRSYIVGQTILCIIAGVVMGLLLTYLDIRYAITLSVFAGVTRAVPIVGPIVSGVAIILVILASNPLLAVKVLAAFTAMHFIESKLVMPVLIGDRMRLHPAVLLASILLSYEFFGLMGMFLAAPVTAVARSLIKTYYIERRDRAALAVESSHRPPQEPSSSAVA